MGSVIAFGRVQDKPDYMGLGKIIVVTVGIGPRYEKILHTNLIGHRLLQYRLILRPLSNTERFRKNFPNIAAITVTGLPEQQMVTK